LAVDRRESLSACEEAIKEQMRRVASETLARTCPPSLLNPTVRYESPSPARRGRDRRSLGEYRDVVEIDIDPGRRPFEEDRNVHEIACRNLQVGGELCPRARRNCGVVLQPGEVVVPRRIRCIGAVDLRGQPNGRWIQPVVECPCADLIGCARRSEEHTSE